MTSCSRRTAEELRRLVVGLLQLEKHGGIRVLVRKDLYGRQVSIVVALPREKFSGSLRRRLQEMFMARFHGTSVDYHLSLGETESARIFFTVHVEPGTQIPEIPYEALEAEVEQLARTWEDDLLDHLVEVFGPERGPVARRRVRPPVPRLLQGGRDRLGTGGRRRHDARAPEDRGRRLRDRDLERGDRRAPHAGQALQDRRQGRPVRVHAAARVARSAGRRGGARSPSRARARSTSTTSACSTRAAPC